MIKKLGKDIAIYGTADFIFKLLGFAVFPIYAHIFSVAEFGVMALVAVSSGLIGMVSTLGINNSVQRFYWDPETEEKQQPLIVTTGLCMLLSWSVVLVAVITLIVYPEREWLFSRFGIDWNIIAVALLTIVPDRLLQYSLDTVRLHFNPTAFVLLSLFKNLLGVFLGLYLILALDMGLYGYFLGILIAYTVSIPLALWYIRKDIVFKIDRKLASRIYSFGYPFVFAGLAYWVFGSLDRWMLATLSNNQEVGLYSIAFKFATIVTFVNGAFGQAWSPYAVKLMRDDANYRATYSRIFSLWFFFLAFLGLAVALFSQELLFLLTPSEYWPAADVLVVVAIGVVLYGTTQITVLGISIEKRTRLLSYGAWITAIINFILNLLLIPRFGALGAAIATLFSYMLLTGFFLYWTQKLHPIPLEKTRLIYACSVLLLALVLFGFLKADSFDLGNIVAKLVIITFVFAGGIKVGIVDKIYFRKIWLSRG